MTMTIQEVEQYVDERMSTIIELQEDFQRKIEEEFHNILKPCMKMILEQLNLEGMLIFGYTPGFNDGDPCEHSTCLPEYYDDEDCYGVNGADMSAEDEADAIRYIKAYDEAKAYSVFNKLIKALDEPFEKVYGTDWYLLFRLKDGEIEVQKGGYDCGY